MIDSRDPKHCIWMQFEVKSKLHIKEHLDQFCNVCQEWRNMQKIHWLSITHLFLESPGLAEKSNSTQFIARA
jgi:hypothetical protein